jgi:hypothetical protein
MKISAYVTKGKHKDSVYLRTSLPGYDSQGRRLYGGITEYRMGVKERTKEEALSIENKKAFLRHIILNITKNK